MVLLTPEVHAYIQSKGIAIGRNQGYAEGIIVGETNTKQAIRDWFARKEEAEKAGVPFNETAFWLT